MIKERIHHTEMTGRDVGATVEENRVARAVEDIMKGQEEDKASLEGANNGKEVEKENTREKVENDSFKFAHSLSFLRYVKHAAERCAISRVESKEFYIPHTPI